MYSLNDPLTKVKGIGKKTFAKFQQAGIETVRDFLLYLPLRYIDRSHITNIKQLQLNQINTIKAKVISKKEYFKNRTRITNATIADDTGRTRCIWFNNRYIKHQLKKNQTYFFSGEYSKYRSLTQPKVEAVKEEQIHTGRLVPLYSQTLKIKQGNLRRFLKEIIDHLALIPDELQTRFNLIGQTQALKQLHFPDQKQKVVQARKRLALEELLTLMKQSQAVKIRWQQQQPKARIEPQGETIPNNLPFTLTNDQQQAVADIMQDLKKEHPMNRLLIGDVGSGKTVVAGIGAWHTIQMGFNAALIAPTQILAEQHLATFAKLFPNLKTQLLTAKTRSALTTDQPQQPTLFIGTHAVINDLAQIKPALIVYDEQHRFGVAQRAGESSTKSKQQQNQPQPHILTMTATPIPRSYMLTIFSHLNVSIIKEMPFGEKPLDTWFVPNSKKESGYQWVVEQLQQELEDGKQQLALVVCPFINPSKHEAFKDVPAATQVYQQLKDKYGDQLEIALLHGQQKSAAQEETIKKLFAKKIDLLVATTIVEVGVDLPQANIMVIEGADRYGLASLHQLRGRVGRQGQQSYCLTFSSSDSQQTKKRLKLFSQESDGLKLAELDLKNRGAGNLFGLQQHGLDQLQFASWNNVELIAQARTIFEQIQNNSVDWQPLITTEEQVKIKAAN